MSSRLTQLNMSAANEAKNPNQDRMSEPTSELKNPSLGLVYEETQRVKEARRGSRETARACLYLGGSGGMARRRRCRRRRRPRTTSLRRIRRRRRPVPGPATPPGGCCCPSPRARGDLRTFPDSGTGKGKQSFPFRETETATGELMPEDAYATGVLFLGCSFTRNHRTFLNEQGEEL